MLFRPPSSHPLPAHCAGLWTEAPTAPPGPLSPLSVPPCNSRPGHCFLLFFAQFSELREIARDATLSSFPKYFMCRENRSRADTYLKRFRLPCSARFGAGLTAGAVREGGRAAGAETGKASAASTPSSLLHGLLSAGLGGLAFPERW